MSWAVWGHCTGGSSPREVRDLPPPCHSLPGPEGAPTPRFRGRARGSTRHHTEGEVPQPHPQGGALARPNHCPREGGCRADSAGLTQAPTAILRVPPPSRRLPCSCHPFHDTEKPRPLHPFPYPQSPVHLPPRVVRSWSQVTRRRGRGLPQARRFLSRSVQTSCSGVGGWDDAGLQSPNLRPSDRGRPLRPGAARAAGE